jgi:hypothetical protein
MKALISIATVAVTGAFTATAAAAPTPVNQADSQNWAGYIAGGQSFRSVSGSWTVPTASANPDSSQSYSATWVGLGGANQSESLEQAGTESDYVNGQPQYSAWYELLPAGQVKLDLPVSAGDRISTTVSVDGTNVTVSMANATTGQSLTKNLTMSNPDTSTAEWIEEAPAAQSSGGNYQILPLADFGQVRFTDATATANGHTGGISDSNWQATQVQLDSGATAGPGGAIPGFIGSLSQSPQSTAGASTSSLSGTGFNVTWNQSSAGGGQPSGDGYPSYGYGGYVYIY